MAKNRTPRIRGARELVATLPNGSSVWLRLRPAPVTVRQFDQLADSFDRTYARRAKTLHSNAAGTKKLVRAVKHDTHKMRRRQLHESIKLRQCIFGGDAKCQRRIDKAFVPVRDQLEKNHTKHLAVLRGSARRDLWNQLVLVSSLLLMAAYGERGKPLSEHNLTIAIALGVWLLGDEVSDLLAGRRALDSGPIRSTDVWSYIAPFANILTGWWLLKDSQHQRFVTGTAELNASSSEDLLIRSVEQFKFLYALVDLSSCIAPEHYSDFLGFENVPALATIQTVEFDSDAQYDCSQIRLHHARVVLARDELRWNLVKALEIVVKVPSQLVPKLKRLQVAWLVDTQKPPLQPSA